ncbi:hypothetical protein PoB_003686900 [Plakobranchus ocellatus]|uniref:Uncharacterized protein n=1 Tax=Plakobranchus ocellatus TaxID=259542 RepID=A0AAV4AW62_9GAST|nr:hypothetical protein PoB_003686900 [Plakobranchus ocellatus]
MDAVFQWNIRGFRSNFEELKLKSAVVALQKCRLEEGQSPPIGLHLLLPQGWVPRGRGGPPHQKRHTFLRN